MKVFWNKSWCKIASTFAKFLKTVKGHYLLKAIVIIIVVIIIIIIIIIINICIIKLTETFFTLAFSFW